MDELEFRAWHRLAHTPGLSRSAARLVSESSWNQRDPQVPKSWWYLTEAQNVGFRVVRPLREPGAEERARFEKL